MGAKRNALGKGLSALITQNLENDDNKKIQDIDTNLIVPNPNQPRKVFEDDKLDELTESIKKHGVIQPIIVRKDKGVFTIIAGERRWRACKNADFKTIPCIVRDIENKNASEIALIENIQREDLNPIEEAKAYEYIIDRYAITQEELSEIVGKSRVYVTNILRLINLDEYVQDKIVKNQISAGHGRALLSLEKEKQIEITNKIIKENLSVRDVEKLVRDTKINKKKTIIEKDKYILHVEEILGEKFSAKVNIKNGKNRGKIEIEYANEADLNRILDMFRVEENL